VGKILIIRLSSIGDIVLTTPVIRCIRKYYSYASIHYLTKKNFEQVLTGNPYINKIHTYDNNLNQTIEALKAEKFDFIVDLHKNIRSSRIKRALKVKSASFP